MVEALVPSAWCVAVGHPAGPDQLIRNQEFDSAITALRHLLEVVNGAEGISDIEHVASEGMERLGKAT